MGGEQHADDQRTEIRLEPDHFKTGGPHYQCQKHPEQYLQLAVTGPLQELEQQRAQQRQSQHPERPDAGQLAAGERQKGHGEHILHYQHPDGDAGVEGIHVAAIFQYLDRKDGAGEGEGEAQQQRQLPVQRQSEVEPQPLADQQHHGKQQGGEQQVQAGGAPHITPHQGLDIELEADGEQQQGDAEIGHFAQGGAIFISHAVEDKTGGQKAEQGGRPIRLTTMPQPKATAIRMGSITNPARAVETCPV